MAKVRFAWSNDPSTLVPVDSYSFERSTDSGATWTVLATELDFNVPAVGADRTFEVDGVPAGVADFRVVPIDADGDAGVAIQTNFEAIDIVPSILGPLVITNL